MALTIVPDKTIGDVFTEAMWDSSIKDNINELIGRSGGSTLTNGGFEVWQRGPGAFASTSLYAADRWYHRRTGAVGGAQTVTQETGTTDASGNALKTVVSAVDGTNKPCVVQRLEHYLALRGREVTMSLRVNQSVANACKVFLLESLTTYTYGSTSASTGSYVTLSATATLGAGITGIEVGLEFTADGTFYVDNAMLVLGPVAAAYVPLHPQEELARCQRYYEVLGGLNPAVEALGYGGAGIPVGQYYPFKQTKPAVPTVTKNGTWGVTNCGQPTIQYVDNYGFHMYTAVTALGGFNFYCNSADDTVTIEYNP